MPNPEERAGEQKTIPERFQVSKATLYFDRFMTSAIVFGGMAIIVSVFGIFAFILGEILPLFRKAAVRKAGVAAAGAHGVVAGMDEWSQLPFLYDGDREIRFIPLLRPGSDVAESPSPNAFRLELPEGAEVTAHNHDAPQQKLIVGTRDGRVGTVAIGYTSSLDAKGQRAVSVELTTGEFYSLPTPSPVQALDFGGDGSAKLFGVIHGDGQLAAVQLRQKRSLLGAGKATLDKTEDLTALLEGSVPKSVLVPSTGDSMVILNEKNELFYLFEQGGTWELRQKFKPFENGTAEGVGMAFILGDVSLAVYDDLGRLKIFSLFNKEGSAAGRTFGLTKEFPPMPGGISHLAASQRNKSFLIAGRKYFRLCHATSATVRHQAPIPVETVSMALDAKGKHAAFVDAAGNFHFYEVNDPHPESSWRAFFGKVWYEGSSQPRYVWQSTGGSDEFEPKLSLVPLIVGSLKGTFYAMFFAVPLALLAAIYVSHFSPEKVKRVVKPMMEIMASLPSVVLGFLAALWLAPLIEDRVPSILTVLVLLPLAAMLIGSIWSRLPNRWRHRLPGGAEFVILVPVVLVFGAAGWNLGPWIESQFFVAQLPDGGQMADFRLWWPQFSGLPYDQRNCLVVGFVMGFAVIPVIFTIAEDALANVPPSITAASEALGASRWQVVRTVVIPIAAAGIFSALMIGFGRAVGETMIVVMATGNTPIMDAQGHLLLGEWGLGGGKFPLADHWNIFNGMRTLSANIAVELPEAPVHSTHYRTLFLGAMVLFMMTFLLNTAAELLRQHLREKFKIV